MNKLILSLCFLGLLSAGSVNAQTPPDNSMESANAQGDGTCDCNRYVDHNDAWSVKREKQAAQDTGRELFKNDPQPNTNGADSVH